MPVQPPVARSLPVSEILLIVRREFRERVYTRAFLLGTLLFPVFMAAVMVLPNLLDRGGRTMNLLVVSEAPAGVTDRFVALLGAEPQSAGDSRYLLEVVPGTLEEVRAQVNQRVQAGDADGYIVLPADVLERGEVAYRASTIGSPAMLREVRVAASQAVQAERLGEAGLELTEVASLLRAVNVSSARITATGEEGGGAAATFLLAYLIAFVIYFMTAVYGVGVLRSVLEEKTNRIAEVLVSSVRASHLMAGKILGVGSAAILQVGIWVVSAALLVTQSDRIAARMGIPPEALRAPEMAPLTAVALLVIFLLGFFLFAALFAALGATVNSEQEAQSLQMLLMIPLFVPLIFIMPLTTDPLGRTATILGLFPLTAPVAMPMRLAATQVPPAQVTLSIVLLLLGLAATVWAAGKIYRIGILSTGKKPSLKELAYWLRTA
jgi:ABC-2 type transport system permease protein